MKIKKTYVTSSQPFGLYYRNGHRLLCSDGVIRSAELAKTADTFFSVPARVRVKGKWVSGYYTTAKNANWSETVCVFRHHTVHSDKLPAWPSQTGDQASQDAHEALVQKAL